MAAPNVQSSRVVGYIKIASALVIGCGLTVAFPTAAYAQEMKYSYCMQNNNPGVYFSDVFEVPSSTKLRDIVDAWLIHLKSSGFPAKFEAQLCGDPQVDKAAMERARHDHADRFYRDQIRYLAWQPFPPIPQGPIQSYNLAYTDGGQAGHGYDSASIKLNYRFLMCADEIQVAYGIDRRTLQHSDRYVVGHKGGFNFEYATPASQPQAPTSVPLNLRVTRKFQSSITTVGHLRDQTAGESLGMGCFTGQTQKIGLVKAMVGPQATKLQIKEYLDSLILAGATANGVVPDLDFPLTNADYPAPPPVRRAVPIHSKKKQGK